MAVIFKNTQHACGMHETFSESWTQQKCSLAVNNRISLIQVQLQLVHRSNCITHCTQGSWLGVWPCVFFFFSWFTWPQIPELFVSVPWWSAHCTLHTAHCTPGTVIITTLQFKWDVVSVSDFQTTLYFLMFFSFRDASHLHLELGFLVTWVNF